MLWRVSWKPKRTASFSSARRFPLPVTCLKLLTVFESTAQRAFALYEARAWGWWRMNRFRRKHSLSSIFGAHYKSPTRLLLKAWNFNSFLTHQSSYKFFSVAKWLWSTASPTQVHGTKSCVTIWSAVAAVKSDWTSLTWTWGKHFTSRMKGTLEGSKVLIFTAPGLRRFLNRLYTSSPLPRQIFSNIARETFILGVRRLGQSQRGVIEELPVSSVSIQGPKQGFTFSLKLDICILRLNLRPFGIKYDENL